MKLTDEFGIGTLTVGDITKVEMDSMAMNKKGCKEVTYSTLLIITNLMKLSITSWFV